MTKRSVSPSTSIFLFIALTGLATAHVGCGDVDPAADANGGGFDAASFDAYAIPDSVPPDAVPPDAVPPDAVPPDASVQCLHAECEMGHLLQATCSSCATSICAADPFCCETQWDSICVGEAETICGMDCPAFCGDQTCDPDEDAMSCDLDCPTCGDGICHETEVDTCPDDCAFVGCGDGTCDVDLDESCGTCPEDCGDCVCGDTSCDPGECASCQVDCPDGCICHDPCETGELLDPSCSTCAEQICAADPFCCQTAWDDICVSEVETVCQEQCPAM